MIRQALKEIMQRLLPDENVIIDHVPPDKTGDYATNIAFKIAAKEHSQPMKVAQKIADQIDDPLIQEVTLHAPGFINFTISRQVMLEFFLKDYHDLNIGHGEHILVEFVSANPTGPLNIVNARAAAVGDSLVRLLNATGYHADAEYYVNDGGRQITLLAESVHQRFIELSGGQARIPKDGYHGKYIKDVAFKAKEQKIEKEDELGRFSVEYFINDHRDTLKRFGVEFTNWVRESSIYKKGFVEKILGKLKQNDFIYCKEGATWLRTTAFGDRDDRVVVTSDDRHTYLLPDIAYHHDKITRGYDRLIDILGPDHQSQIKSMQSSLQAIGYPAEILNVIIIQQVNIRKSGKILKMSKRAGYLETLTDLLDQVPVDVVRFFLLMRTNSQHLDFDIDLAQQQSDENPVYYVQYAHARIHSILKKAAEQGIQWDDTCDKRYITEPEEFDLIKTILQYPEVLEDAVKHLEPYMITYYLISLAKMFHYFYQRQRVISDDIERTRARLALINKTCSTIKHGLTLLGVSSPEHM